MVPNPTSDSAMNVPTNEVNNSGADPDDIFQRTTTEKYEMSQIVGGGNGSYGLCTSRSEESRSCDIFREFKAIDNHFNGDTEVIITNNGNANKTIAHSQKIEDPCSIADR